MDCWQIDAGSVRLAGRAWPDSFAKLIDLVAVGLGLSGERLGAELSKLLVYRPGGFFAWTARTASCTPQCSVSRSTARRSSNRSSADGARRPTRHTCRCRPRGSSPSWRSRPEARPPPEARRGATCCGKPWEGPCLRLQPRCRRGRKPTLTGKRDWRWEPRGLYVDPDEKAPPDGRMDHGVVRDLFVLASRLGLPDEASEARAHSRCPSST